jgi:protein-tyrosine phosphatase
VLVSGHWSPQPVFTVLVVCTGNICRSALAERLGRAYLDDRLGADANQVRMTSAGVGAVVGSAMHPDSALVLQGYGGDPAGFTARQLVESIAIDADLTLTLTRAHRRRVLELAPRALSRTFALREAAGLLELLGADLALSGEGLVDRARTLVRDLHAARSRRQATIADDIGDPIGRSLEVHEEIGEAVAEALLPILARIAALHAPAGAVSDPDAA